MRFFIAGPNEADYMTDTQKTIDLSPRFQVFISSPSGLDDEKSIVVEGDPFTLGTRGPE